jgi:hypothetical protein
VVRSGEQNRKEVEQPVKGIFVRGDFAMEVSTVDMIVAVCDGQQAGAELSTQIVV